MYILFILSTYAYIVYTYITYILYTNIICIIYKIGLPWWLSSKESACQAGEASLIPGLGRSPGEGNGNPLLYSSLGNPMDRGTWWAIVHGIAKELDMT